MGLRMEIQGAVSINDGHREGEVGLGRRSGIVHDARVVRAVRKKFPPLSLASLLITREDRKLKMFFSSLFFHFALSRLSILVSDQSC